MNDILSYLRKEYVVIGKRRVRSWHAWFVIGIVAGAVAGILWVASRSGEVTPGEAADPGRPVQSQITQVEKFKAAMVKRAAKKSFTIPQFALNQFEVHITQAQLALTSRNYESAGTHAKEAKESIDWPGVQKAIDSAEKFRENIIAQAAKQRFVIPPFALTTSETLLIQGRTAFGEGRYADVKLHAEETRSSIDYKTAQRTIQQAEKQRTAAAKKKLPEPTLQQIDQLIAQAKELFSDGDYRPIGELMFQAVALARAEFTITPPVITPSGGPFNEEVIVTMEIETLGAEIRYTTDGLMPTKTATLYTGPFTLSESATVKAKAFLGGVESTLSSAVFMISLPEPEPGGEGAVRITPEGGQRNRVPAGVVTVTMQTDIPGAEIFYTTDGRTPTPASGTKYVRPFELDLKSERLGVPGQIPKILRAKVVKANAFVNGVSQGEFSHQTYFGALGGDGSRFQADNRYGEIKYAVVQFSFNDIPAVPTATLESAYFTHPTDSYNAFHKTISFSQSWFVGKVFGPYHINANARDIVRTQGCAGLEQLLQSEWLKHSGEEGAEARPIYFLSQRPDCIPRFDFDYQFGAVYPVAEYAHGGYHDTTGIGHAYSLMCPRDRATDAAEFCGSAGDGSHPFDILGVIWKALNYNAAEKQYFGYLPLERFPEVTRDGTYTIHTISGPELPSEGNIALRIPLAEPHGERGFYTIEYRQPIGSDGRLRNYPGFTKGVSIHLAGLPDLSIESMGGPALLDLTPTGNSWGDVTDGALGDGQSFYDDVNDITVTQLAHTPTTATVQVKFGPVPCRKARPAFMPTLVITPVLVQKSPPGQKVTFSASVRNGDMRTCSSTAFAVGAAAPAGFTVEVESPSLIVPAGAASQPVRVFVTSPSNTSTGRYQITGTATDPADATRKATIWYILDIDPSLPPASPPLAYVTGFMNTPNKDPAYDLAKGIIRVRTSASSPSRFKIANVELLLDGTVIGTSIASDPPDSQYFFFDWDTTKTSDGPHILSARATDEFGNVGSGDVDGKEKSLRVMVWNGPSPKPNGHIVVYPGFLDGRKDAIEQSKRYTLGVWVFNNGGAEARNIRVRLFPSLAALPTYTTTAVGMADKRVTVTPGTYKQVELTFKAPATLGDHTAYLLLDDGDPGSVDEIDDSLVDNTAKLEYKVVSPVKPELQAALAIVGDVIAGQQATAEVDILESGGKVEDGTQVRVRFWPHLTSPPNYNTPSPVPDKMYTLGVGGEAVRFTFNAGSAGAKTAYVVIDNGDPGAIDESNDTIQDNTASRGYTVE